MVPTVTFTARAASGHARGSPLPVPRSLMRWPAAVCIL